jgi:hypothetical protein
MASIHEILETEDDGKNVIHLYLEGIFWKAYQQSAYRLTRRVGSLKVSKKYIKTVAQEVVSVGFPDTSLQKHFSDREICKIDDKRITIPDEQTGSENYQEWFLSVSLTPGKKPEANQLSQSIPLSEAERSVLKQLREYNVEGTSLMQCLNFLAEMRRMLIG